MWKVHAIRRNGQTINETTTYTYTAVGSRDTVTLPNNTVTAYKYDELNRLTNLTHTASGGALLASYTYQLHPTGRRTNAVEVLLNPDDNTYITNTTSWQYDGLYRLTNEVSTSTSSALAHSTAYSYDLNGNRVKKVDVVGGTTTTITNLYNANDQLLKEVTLVAGAPTATNNYVYDANGSLTARTNITSGGTATALYDYDLKNKLSAVTTGGSTTKYEYNHQGIRVRSITGGSTKYYLVDGNNHTGYAQVLEEMTTLGTPTMSYVLGDDVLAQCGTTTSDPAYLLYDGHGSTRQLVHSTGNVTEQYNYDAYGVSLTTLSTPETTMLYSGEQYDSTLGMYNNRARFYDPANGRFNARDTFAGSNSDPQSLHKYAYCHSDPVNGIDPSGLFSLMEVGTVGLIVTALFAATGFVINKKAGGSGLKGALLGAVAGGSLTFAYFTGNLYTTLLVAFFQGAAQVAIDAIYALAVNEEYDQSKAIDSFFTGFAIGAFAGAFEFKFEQYKVAAPILAGVLSVVSDAIDKFIANKGVSGKEILTNAIIAMFLTAIIPIVLNHQIPDLASAQKLVVITRFVQQNPVQFEEMMRALLGAAVGIGVSALGKEAANGVFSK